MTGSTPIHFYGHPDYGDWDPDARYVASWFERTSDGQAVPVVDRRTLAAVIAARPDARLTFDPAGRAEIVSDQGEVVIEPSRAVAPWAVPGGWGADPSNQEGAGVAYSLAALSRLGWTFTH